MFFLDVFDETPITGLEIGVGVFRAIRFAGSYSLELELT